MKLLLDQNISYKLIKLLQNYFAEVAQVGRLGMAQTEDAMIWQFVRTHEYMMVTFDSYFQERNLISENPIKVILLKIQNTSTQNIARVLIENQTVIQEFSQDELFSCLEITDNES